MPRTLLAALAAMCIVTDADAQTAYRKPPKAVADILDAPPTPAVSLSPDRKIIALVTSSRYPSIADLAEPMLRLAGLRISPRTNGPARAPRVTGIALMPVDGGEPRPVKLPEGGKPSSPHWSPDGKRFAVTNTTPTGIELWVGDVASAALKKVEGVTLNAAIGDAVQWMPDAKTLLVQLVPAGRGQPPVAPETPPGPTIQEASGKAAPVRTYQDLLKNAHDEDLFGHYATSQLATVAVGSGAATPIGKPGVYLNAEPSPDGKLLLVSRIKRPYSYLYPVWSFPRVIEVWDLTGNVVHTVADLPLQDQVPIQGVPTGPRAVQWVPNRPATLVWTEALDDGDPKKKVPHRDQLFTQAAPFSDKPHPAGKVVHRYAGLSFFEDGDTVLLRDYDRDRRWGRTILANLADPEAERTVVFDRSIQDRYNDPGTPVMRPLPNGQRVLRTAPGGRLFLSGSGATPKGEFPFLDLFDLKTGKTERLFRCGDKEYASVAAVLADDGSKLLIRRESPTDPPNYFLRTNGQEKPLTKFPDPFPELHKVKQQLVTTKRPDGVTISFTLYLPPGYEAGKKLPTVFWAYPREFNTADTAGQVSGSPNQFVRPAGTSHLFFLTQGYAVMDEVTIPIVGAPEKANDTYVEQLVSSAKAAIDKAAELGPIDTDRIGVMGHSYGAFMTANLLAHSDLFRAGVARSGAYNRTLTPFGFQNERRTFWEAPDVYGKMSPFYFAHKINEPLLLIHGEADNNSGTFPVQSERMYQAVRGTGGTVRLVMLPHESHGYAARESVGHVLAEMIDWFDKYVKGAGPRPPKGTGEK
ncbi:MAG TPA: prolyl oligopeptidase family serine peptidase [Fimbriiglobus sp.]|nr:prolyl oligopeptidase family serine peptidase [Fimbriiglobus sp.]